MILGVKKVIKQAFILSTCFAVLVFAGGCAPPAESPEHIYNMANNFMRQGDYPRAIECFYMLDEHYKGYKDYKCEVLSRLGWLLYETERYDEAEKVLSDFIMNYSKSSDRESLKKACAQLMYIYMQEMQDAVKVNAVRSFYVARFGEDRFIEELDKTIAVLKLGILESSLLKLNPKELTIKSQETTLEIDREFFPILNSIKRSVRSPDKRMIVERKRDEKETITQHEREEKQ